MIATSPSSSPPVAAVRAVVDLTAAVRRHMPVLDGLRGLAILLVLVHNVAAFQKQASSALMKGIYFLHAPGWVGVQLFFVLSGFLITGILLDSRGTPHALRGFWIRRALRIFPLFYLFLFLTTVVGPLVGLRPNGLENAGWYWAYLCNFADPAGHSMPAFAHLWSLAVEEQFYFVWPLVVLATGPRALLRASLGLAVVAFVARVALRAAGAPVLDVYEYTFTRMDALTLGGAAALIVRDPAWLARVTPWLGRLLVGAAVVLLAMWPLTRGFNRDDLYVQTVGYGVLSVLFFALVLSVVRDPGSRLARALSGPWLRWLGKYSYAIYVFHLPIAWALAPWFEGRINGGSAAQALPALVGFVVVVGGLSVAAAVASWNLVERWALALKDRWAPRVTA